MEQKQKHSSEYEGGTQSLGRVLGRRPEPIGQEVLLPGEALSWLGRKRQLCAQAMRYIYDINSVCSQPSLQQHFFMYVCVHMCMWGGGLHVYDLCVEVRGQNQVLASITLQVIFYFYFFQRQGLSLYLELISWFELARHQTPEILLFLPSQAQDYRHHHAQVFRLGARI